MMRRIIFVILCCLSFSGIPTAIAQGKPAPKPLFDDPIFHGAARPGHKSNVEFTKMLRKLYLQKKIEKQFQVMKSKDCVFDIEAILEIMPHRYPFLLVDRIIEMEVDKRIVGIKNVTYNEPFFNGHFPNKRVMPGVLIVEAMAQCGFILL